MVKYLFHGQVTLFAMPARIFLIVALLALVAPTNVVCKEIQRTLPDGNLILAYATSCVDDGATVLAEAREGVNVIVWFATNLVRDSNGKAAITYGLNSTCVAVVAKTLRSEGLETTHLVSIGGWDAPHPNTFLNGTEWFKKWHAWNTGNTVARPSLGFYGFDGFDWDLEGNDDKTSPWNHFSLDCMHLVGDMSVAAKANGYLVTMVPPESYLDPMEPRFDLSLLHAYEDGWQPQFTYHGRNAYAYLLSKYSQATFDLVDIQLYETFSHADFYITHKGQDPSDYLVSWVRNVTKGWIVNYTGVDIMPQRVNVDPSRLIVGFSFGSGSGRSVFVWPSAVAKAYAKLAAPPRGVMYWNMNLDRDGTFNSTIARRGYTFAKAFNAFLKTRT